MIFIISFTDFISTASQRKQDYVKDEVIKITLKMKDIFYAVTLLTLWKIKGKS